MKVVVVGPPHSGKSVFLQALCECLPRFAHFLFRACPDGEGTWLAQHYDDPTVVALRRKGSFSAEMVDWYCQSLARCEMAPIVLVDVGGRTSAENARILREGGVQYGIILAGNQEAIPEWERFLREVGVAVIAVIHSDYCGTEDAIQERSPRLVGSVHHLERGEEKTAERPMIQATAELLLSLTEHVGEKKEEEIVETTTTLTISEVAAQLGKAEVEKTLPNGRVVRTIVWEGSDLPAVAELLHHRSAEMAPVVQVDGPAPAWLALALVHEVHPREAALNSPDGFVGVGCQRPAGEGSGSLTWSVSELPTVGERRCVKVEFALDPSVPFAPAQLTEVVPPAVGLADVVVLSGRGPNWLMASIGMSYHGRAAACAPWQPGTGATVAWTHVADVELGSVIVV